MTFERATIGSAGYDFVMPYDLDLEPNKVYKIDTGVKFNGHEHVLTTLETTDGIKSVECKKWFMAVFPRSSYGTKYGLRFQNTVSIIDMDYRDTIKAFVSVDVPVTIKKGQKFAQGILIPFGTFHDEIKPVCVRFGGLGSTGQ